MTYYAICEGADIKICGTCRRFAEFNPDAAQDPFQARMAPQADLERCPAWMPKPATNPPRAHTGD
ncbi:hypothetical protein [Arenimonas oryziterrae]|uniref:Uncharacterized protein n=1 Tax=Arenimonas oryziterrae DSM 21050 = YC6267 TaxID=1121015 RepID=A0A091AT25_9GAMM|nr:hypothetical protein [Arenimonas oryziterrae]KFN42317.1 hypothetical protein N789_14080 [Arenimonas oryziterrae DSM 21050 = YC6267]